MKKNQLIILLMLSMVIFQSKAQNKLTLVEYYTNTLCSNCASRNPGFFQNLQAQKDVLHITFHPSSPYPACVLNKHNKAENDARTNYYGIYGSTPRLVINGVVQSNSANYGSSSLFTPFAGLIQELDIKVYQQEVGDSLKSRVVIKRLSTKDFAETKLFVGYLEDTLFYNAPNGETKHYNVFRKSTTGIQGTGISLPVNTTDSVEYFSSTIKNSEWVKNRIYTIAWVQKVSDKSIIEAAKSKNSSKATSGINALEDLSFSFYPNPVIDKLQINLAKNNEAEISIFNLFGDEILKTEIKDTKQINTSEWKAGIYFVQIKSESGFSNFKFIKQ